MFWFLAYGFFYDMKLSIHSSNILTHESIFGCFDSHSPCSDSYTYFYMDFVLICSDLFLLILIQSFSCAYSADVVQQMMELYSGRA